MKTLASINDLRDGPLKKLRILVIDDDEIMLYIIAENLKGKNYEVITCNHAREALSMIFSYSIDVVISDILMPGISGYMLVNFLRKMHCSVPVILISSLKEASVNESIEDMRTTDFMAKPLDYGDLCQKIESVVLAKG